jgi:hypothetical protein
VADIFLRPGEASPNDVKLRDPTLSDSGGFTSTATWDQAAASWDAQASTAGASDDFTATFIQVAGSWAATEAETFAATATFTQAPASWTANVAERFDSTAAFNQATATWAAVASEAFATTGSFTQAAAAWSAIVAETFAATATWTQAAGSWAASVNQTSDRTSTATFNQATGSWDASFVGPESESGGTGGKFGIVRSLPQRRPKLIPAIDIDVAFTQSVAEWSATAQRIQPAVAISASFVQSNGWAAASRVTDDDLVLVLA